MDYFQFLPQEILLDILTRLPAECVLNSKSVCSNWRRVVRHPYFSKMHLHHHLNHAGNSDKSIFIAYTFDTNHDNKFHYFELNENHDESTAPVHRITRVNLTSPINNGTKLVGSSNGLICLEGLSVCICNPITREYVLLPEIKAYVGGFGYVSCTDEYKVVGIHESGKFVEVHVYTLGSCNGWRNLGKFDLETSTLSDWDGTGVFVNGALHWLHAKLRMIISFDLAEEKFREHLPLPPIPEGSVWFYYAIGVLDGCLFFLLGPDDEVDRFNDVWLLKRKIDNRGVKAGDERQALAWSREFRVDGLNLLAITKTGGVFDCSSFHLNVCDTKTSTSKRLVRFKDEIMQVCPHMNTFVSLKELGEEDTKIMESVGIEETRSQEQLQEPEYIYL